MKVVVFGFGGQAREVAWYLDALGHECVAFLVASAAEISAATSKNVFTEQWLDEHASEVDGFVLGVGTPAARLRIAESMLKAHPNMSWPTIVHPSAVIDRSSSALGDGVMICASAIATVDVKLESFSMVNFGATLGHDVRVGRGAVVNPGANVSGGVELGEGVLIGAGAVILQYRKIGARAVVGAGAVVTHDVPAGATVVGIPAREVSRT